MAARLIGFRGPIGSRRKLPNIDRLQASYINERWFCPVNSAPLFAVPLSNHLLVRLDLTPYAQNAMLGV